MKEEPQLHSDDLNRMVQRDRENAREAKEAADRELRSTSEGSTISQVQAYRAQHVSNLQWIAANPFQAMVEAELYTQNGSRQRCVLYGNNRTVMNEVLQTHNGDILVMSWTHPAIQHGLTADIGETADISADGYKLTAITPISRARLSRVLPYVSGLYDPGGSVGPERKRQSTGGLRSVKLAMTKEQVSAFLSKMEGMMLVTGAPGSGKTTVAFQRVRFLFEQQSETSKERRVRHSPESTKIFLANQNLLEHCRNLLVAQLSIPADVVSLVPDFIHGYLQQVWLYKGEARVRARRISTIEQRAREAVFCLGKAKNLGSCWKAYESQIAFRLSSAPKAEWLKGMAGTKRMAQECARNLARSLASQKATSRHEDPRRSSLRMQSLFERVQRPYEELRSVLAGPVRRTFDKQFRNWLFHVYDPLNALAAFFHEHRDSARNQIRKGTASRVDEDDVLSSIEADWALRQYGPEEEPWLAWLLRYALPETAMPSERFREIPCALPDTGNPGQGWTHVVIDEAQDLSVVEASLLGSFVHPHGAITVAADFRQVVSPVHGMTDAQAFNVGSSLQVSGAVRFPFRRNMRQSRSISRFLQGFYEAAFGEVASFDTSNQFDDQKPLLFLGNSSAFPRLTKQLLKALKGSKTVCSICLVQINEDEEAMRRLRAALKESDVAMAPIWSSRHQAGKLLTTSVERIKGLEYDACIVLGLDDVERAALNFTKNRAYVALSRPVRRLFMFCEEFPGLLQRVDKRLYETRKIG